MLGSTGTPLAATDRAVAQLRTPAGDRAMIGASAAAFLLALLLCVAVTQHGLLAGRSAARELAGSGSEAALNGDPAYRITDTAGALVAQNPAQGLSSRFARSGVYVRSGDLSLAMRLRTLGGHAVSAAPAPVLAPGSASGRILYARAGVSEWYVNGPRGLEQGFTVERTAAGVRPGMLTLAIGISGRARATISPDARSISFTRGSASLRYGGLSVRDARGRVLPSSLSLVGSEVRVRVDTRGGRYPLQIDPLIEQGGRLTGSDEQGAGQFGLAAALSEDGSTALVGAPRDQEFAGAAWAYTRSGDTWTSQGGKLTSGEVEPVGEEVSCDEEPGEADDCGFGRAIAISADGSTALIGAPRVGEGQGAAWIFNRSGSTWTRGEKLIGGVEETKEGHFGRGVALSADGKTALVGAPGDRSHRGSIWTFVRSGAAWSQQGAKLIAADAVGQTHFGGSVSLSTSGATALVGGPGDNANVGASWVFTRSGTSWLQAAKLTGSDEAGAGHLGASTALSAAGDMALIGGRRDANNLGAAWAFKLSGGKWAQQGPKLTAQGEDAHGEFGFSVALTDDGSTALIGAPRDDSFNGAVRQFVRSGDSWAEQSEQLAGAGGTGNPWFGASVALSGDGAAALVGGAHDAGRVGAAWTFTDRPFSTQPPTVSSLAPAEGPTSGGTSVRISGTNFTAATAVHFGALAAASLIVRSATLIEALAPPAPPGTVEVTVSTPGGTSALAPPGDRFTFTGPSPGGGGASGADAAATNISARFGLLGASAAASARCQLAPASKRIAVLSRRSSRSAAIRLLRTGTGACGGRLTLSFKVKRKGKRFRLKAIGTAAFSISLATSQVVKINLNSYGRKLLRARKGRLNATLTIVRVSPAPLLGSTARVRLSLKKAPQRGSSGR